MIKYKKMFSLLIIAILAISAIGTVSAYDRIPFKFHNADSWVYHDKYVTNAESVDVKKTCGRDFEGYMTFDMFKPIDTLNISYTCDGTDGKFVGIIFHIPSKDKLLSIDRFDVYCNHDSNGYDKMRVDIKYDKGLGTKSFTVDDKSDYNNEIGNTRYRHYTI